VLVGQQKKKEKNKKAGWRRPGGKKGSLANTM